MPMPSMQDLQTMYGAWNPQAYLQGQQNAGLEQQYQQSQNDKAAELAKQASLDTLFKQQDDPNRVQERVLTNQNLGYTGQGTQLDNERKTRENRIAAANEQYKITADKAEMLSKATAADLKNGEDRAKQLMMSLDPIEQEKGKRLYGLTAHARDLADQRQQALDLADKQGKYQNEGHRISAGATIQAARIGADSRLEIAKLKQNATKGMGDIEQQVKSGKLTFEKAAALLHGASMFEPDPELKQQYAAMAQQYEQANLNARNAGSGNKVDVGAATGMPATAAPAPALGTPTKAPRGNGTAANPIVLK